MDILTIVKTNSRRMSLLFILVVSIFTYYQAGPHALPSAKARTYYQKLPRVIELGSLTASIMNLYRMNDRDSMILRLDSRGGVVWEAENLISAIKSTGGNLTCRGHYQVASAAAIIMLACPKVEIDTDAHIMFHLPRYYIMGKMISIVQGEERRQHIEYMIKLGIKDVLSEDEFRRYTEGEDVYVLGRSLVQRMPAKFKELE